ncbi:aldehyde dehydrogenase family protein [Paraburkholderia antibiotica]|uniref:aldehyde dehydrogenase family protein n=1 Tax=Paraburkholderia antibiotica TaxID=2728839 RepID=UPI002E3022F3|nr:aldehyde dehydrogenase family protein [Paraburkholderia antibiotica]
MTYKIPQQIESFLCGEWQAGAGAGYRLQDKFSTSDVAIIKAADKAQVQAAVAHAGVARKSVPGPHARGEILERAAKAVEARRAVFATVLCIEAGFTDVDAQNEITRCVQTLQLCAEEARRFCGEMIPLEGAPGQAGRLAFTLRRPLGTVVAITPFNSPLNTVAHKVGPAFAAGNAVILKPSRLTPFSSNVLVEALLEAGMPKGMIALLHGGADVANWLLDERDTHFVAFTGSTDVGRSIQGRLGLRRSQMELGSIAHVVIDESADVVRAVPRIVGAGFRKAGQVCTSTQILLVHRSRVEEVTKLMSQQVKALGFGDPTSQHTIVGPMISEGEARRVQAWIEEAVSQGAQAIVRGERKRSVVAPTILVDTTPEMKVRSQEVFGPVLSIVPFDSFDDALEQVNRTPYGLAAGVFTNSLENGFKAARLLEVGSVHINEASSSRADVMPFGGCKDSGFGKEGPAAAVREMSEERLITIANATA